MELEYPDKTNYLNAKKFKKDLLKKFKLSFLTHLLAIILLLSYSFIFKSKPITFSPSIRVDLVGLPDLTMKEMSQNKINTSIDDLSKKIEEIRKQPPPPAPDIVSLKAKDSKDSKEKPKSNSLKNAIDRIRALEAIESKESNDPKNHLTKKIELKGNTTSKGNSLTGEQNQSISEYGDKIRSKLNENWDLPVWLSKQNLSAQVAIYLNQSGFVTKTIFLKPSGNEQFDEYVSKTIKSSQPFGPPPDEILHSGVKLGFPL